MSMLYDFSDSSKMPVDFNVNVENVLKNIFYAKKKNRNCIWVVEMESDKRGVCLQSQLVKTAGFYTCVYLCMHIFLNFLELKALLKEVLWFYTIMMIFSCPVQWY